MNFRDAQAVQSTISAGDDVEEMRANNRVKVNQFLDGFPP